MNRISIIILIVIGFSACMSKKEKKLETAKQKQYSFDLQGHRGARGLAPENTLSAFQKALDFGVNTLELDVVISKDNQVVVSHEPWFNTMLTLTPESEEMEEEKTPSTNFYQMNYATIRKYDCGSRAHPNFPNQENEKAYKPLLKEVLQTMEKARKAKGVRLHYNIEIKSMPQGDNIFHPEPKPYVDLVVATIKEELPDSNFNIQSFDLRILKVLHTDYPQIALAVLVAEGSLYDNLEKLGFEPEIYSPKYTLVDGALVTAVHKRGMKLIPWTVNMPKDMKELLELGVDGLITDYPDRAAKLRK